MPLDLKGLRVGYVPYDDTLRRPGDRRRFVYYAHRRGLPFEIARPHEAYDLVVVTAGGDISLWSRYQPGKARIIYEQIDSYLAIPTSDAKGALRGLAKFATRQNRHLLLSYSEGIRRMCRRADAVICTTAEQRQALLACNQNTHIILDFQGTVASKVKTDYAAGDTFNLVWEGLPGNLGFFDGIRQVLAELGHRRKLALHAVTDLEYGQYLGGKYGRRRTLDLIRRTFDIPVYLYAWNEQLAPTIITACDLALIPIPLGDPLNAGKPENKLLLFWRMAVPTVVSATPAYARVMQHAGLSMACRDREEWLSILEHYISDEQARREAGRQGKLFAERHYGEEKMLQQWDDVLQSVLHPETR